MIKINFRLGGEEIEVVIRGNELLFSEVSSGSITTVEGLRFSKAGVVKEFPDLKNNPDWKKIAIERFKAHVKSLETENEKVDYVIEELKKHAYEPLFKQKAGWRPVKIK